MGFVINNNLAANNSYRNLNATQNDLSKSLEKLSTGLRINRAGDDAAGLSISEGLKSQVTGSAQAARNAQDGIIVIQTAEGALTEVHSILQRVRDLAVQAGNDSNNDDARDCHHDGSDCPRRGADRIGESTNFNGIKPARRLGGSAATVPGRRWRHGARRPDHRSTSPRRCRRIKTVGTAITGDCVATDGFSDATVPRPRPSPPSTPASRRSRPQRADLGAAQNRLEHTIKSLNVAGENLQAAQSRIADVDMAQEMVKFTKANILSQAGTAMLAQANQSSQGVLSLLR